MSSPNASPCPNMPTCELFPHLTKGGFMRVWQVNYCESGFAKCERYKLSMAGRSVPTLLLPNGQNLSTAVR